MQKVLIDGRELFPQRLIQLFQNFRRSLHDSPLLDLDSRPAVWRTRNAVPVTSVIINRPQNMACQIFLSAETG